MYIDRITELKVEWGKLCAKYLPVSPGDSVWRYSRRRSIEDPDQGWKIHLSATVLTASSVLTAVAPMLVDRGVLFKAPLSLDELIKINSGLAYGYAQVGKFLTVYPRNKVEFTSLARDLHRKLPARFGSPTVPFDFRLAKGSRVFYRYGAFSTRPLTAEDGSVVPAMLAPDGTLIPDLRGVPPQIPPWEKEPFPRKTPAAAPANDNPLVTRYHIFRSLTQRGKGGVYQAFDTATTPPRLCIIKEGRRHGETAWDGRDGRARVENEVKVLAALSEHGTRVPRVYDSFEIDRNFYLVLEQIGGENLQKMITDRKKPLSTAFAIESGKQIAALAAEIHAAGWVWRDCKPANLFVTAGGKLRPIDFEGSIPINKFDPMPWSSPHYTPQEVFRENRTKNTGSHVAEDLFALGTCLFYLFEGKLPRNSSRSQADVRSRHADKGLCHADNGECHANNCLRQANNGDCHTNNCLCQSNICLCAADISECLVENGRLSGVEFERRSVPNLVKRLILLLLSEDPTRRPRAATVFEALSSVERHLPQKLRISNIVADRIEERLHF